MSVKRKTINLTVTGNTLIATDATSNDVTTDAGVQGENGAVWLHCPIPEDWQDLNCRLDVTALNAAFDESGAPADNAIDMALNQGILVPGNLIVSLKGTDADSNIRKTADCRTLIVQPSTTGQTAVAASYPQAFESLQTAFDTLNNGIATDVATCEEKSDASALSASNAAASASAAQTAATQAQTSEGQMSQVLQTISAPGIASPKSVYATLAALQAAYPSGTSGIYLVTADGNWYYWNGTAWTAGGVYQSTGIADQSVTQPKTDFVTIGKNLYDTTAAVEGSLSYSDGTIGTSSDFLITPFMPVVAGKTIYASSNNGGTTRVLANMIYRMCYYDSSKNFLGAVAPNNNIGTQYVVSGNGAAASTILIPSNAIYVRLMIYIDEQNHDIQIEYDQMTDFEPYGYEISKLLLSNSVSQNAADISQLQSDLDNLSVTPEQTDFISYVGGKNLLDESKMVIGSIDASGNLIANSSSQYIYTPVLNVTPGKTVYWGKTDRGYNGTTNIQMLRVHMFDKSGVYLGSDHSVTNWIASYTIPSGTYGIILLNAVSNINLTQYDYQVEYDQMTAYEPYQPYRQIESDIKITTGNRQMSNTVDCWGDSLTDGTGSTPGTNDFVTVLQNLVGYQHYARNCGIGGEGSENIAMRQGGLPFQANPFTIPADTSAATITLRNKYSKTSVPMFIRGGSYVDPNFFHLRINPVQIAGVEGTLARPSLSSYNYTFTRSVAGNAVTLSRPEYISTYASRNQRDNTAVIWIGTNDVTHDINFTIEQQQHIVGHLTHDRYIVVGLTAKTYFPTDIADRNAAMAEQWGEHFIDVRDYLLEFGLSDAGITPTSQDTTDLANGEIPTSLRYDAVHLNPAGYATVAKAVYKKGVALGYWG